MLAAADERGLMIATVYKSPGREERVIELDDDAHADAQGWAGSLPSLPARVIHRYRDLIVAEGDKAREGGASA